MNDLIEYGKEIWNVVSLCVVQAILCRGSILPKLLNMLEGKGMRVLDQEVFSLENIKKHQGNDAFPNAKHFLFLFLFIFILFYCLCVTNGCFFLNQKGL
jgi:hypothetical protein